MGGEAVAGGVTAVAPGLGFDCRVFQGLRLSRVVPIPPLASQAQVKETARLLREEAPDSVVVVGWSLGGLAALALARSLGGGLRSLVLISIRRRYPLKALQSMEEAVARDREGGMREFYKGCFAGQKRDYLRFRQELEDSLLASWSSEDLVRGFRLLAAPFPPLPRELGPRCRILHGLRDRIAPVEEMVEPPPGAKVELVPAGHLPFLHPRGRRFVEEAVWKG